jgi:hypothetical protein
MQYYDHQDQANEQHNILYHILLIYVVVGILQILPKIFLLFYIFIGVIFIC